MEKATFFCVYLVEGITAWQYFSAVFTPNKKLVFRAAVFVLGYFLGFLLFNLSIVWLNTTFFTVLNFLLLKFLYSCSWKSVFFHSIFLTCLMLGSELTVEFILGMLFGGAVKYRTNLPILVILCVFSKFLYFLTTKICLRLSHNLPSNMPDAGPSALLLGSFSFSTIFILIIMAYSVMTIRLTPRMETLLMVGALILLLSDIAIYAGYQYSQKLNRQNLELQLMQQKDQTADEYFHVLEDQYERQQVLLHDLRRHLTAIKEFALENEDQQVVHYVSNLQNLPALQRKLKFCENLMLNVVLARYKELSDEKGIQFSADVRDVDMDFLAQNDITALFGNLLENAVESAEKSEKPYIELIIGSNGDTHSDAKLFVSLTNSCDSEPLKDSAGNFLTHKLNKEWHGMGQKSIKRAVKKYGGTLEHQYCKETHLFHTSILF
jgi:two-component system sensor histidine kinase AgrC